MATNIKEKYAVGGGGKMATASSHGILYDSNLDTFLYVR